MGLTALQGIGLQDARVQLDRAATIVKQVLRDDGEEPGVSFARAAISQMLSDGDPAELAAQRWGSHSNVVGVLKANVAGGGTPTWGDVVGSAGGQFLSVVEELSVLGRMGARRGLAGVPGIMALGGSTAAFVGEGAAIPASRTTFDRSTLYPKKIAGIAVFSEEIIKHSDPRAEILVRDDLARVVARAGDTALLAPGNAGDAATPKSILNGQPTFAAGSDIAEDVAELVSLATAADLTRAVLIMHPQLATLIGLKSTAGIGRDVGSRGGTLAGFPVLTSMGAPVGVVALVDPSAIIVVDAGVETTRSESALIEMSDGPAGNSLTPIAASVTRVPLFTTHSRAVRVSHLVNWAVLRPNSIAYATGAAY